MISTDTLAAVVRETGLPRRKVRALLRGPRATALVWLSVYLWLSGLVLGLTGHAWLASAHVAGIGIAAWGCFDRSRTARIVGDLLPLIVAPVLYGEIPLLIAALGSSYHDAFIQHWELAVFKTNPSRVLATFMPNPAWSELLHIGYLAYYPAIFIPPLVLFMRGDREGYGQTVAALTVAYVICWLAFAIAPVEGPRYLWTPNVPDGPMRRLAVAILAAGSSRGAAFPSSHMTVSVVQTVMAFRWQPKSGAILALVSALVGLGAVYGGFHYGVDMIAGAVLGLVIGGGMLLVRWKND